MDKPPAMVGVSAAVRHIEEDIQYAARSGASVLITGESGVGKEAVARLLHQRSERRNRPLATVNCAGVPESVLECELFGQGTESVTDGRRDKSGWLAVTDGGTIFIDEVSEMSMRLQASLVRFLETGMIQHVTVEPSSPRVDVRVIAATHQPLVERIANRSFREDLYYRLNIMHIEIPALRERREDIAILLNHFLRVFSDARGARPPEVSAETLRQLIAYDWPGNMRELRNVAERLVWHGQSETIELSDLLAETATDTGGARANVAV